MRIDTPDIDEEPVMAASIDDIQQEVKPRKTIKHRISKGLSKISLNRLSVMVSPNRVSLAEQHLFPNMPYFNISDGLQETETEMVKALQEEMELLPDPINPIIVERVLQQCHPGHVDGSDTYYYTNVYENTIRDYLREAKQDGEMSQEMQEGGEKAKTPDKKLKGDILQLFDDPTTCTFSDLYDSNLDDFHKYDRKIKREMLLKTITEDAYELERINGSHCLLNIGSVDDLQSKFYINEPEISTSNSSKKHFITGEALKIPKLFNHQFGSSPTLQDSCKPVSKRDSGATIDVDEMSSCSTLEGSCMRKSVDSSSSDFMVDVELVAAVDTEKNQPIVHNGLQRKLSSRALQMIAFGSALGNGLLLNSGKNFTISGPLGTLLGFFFLGLIVLASMLSYCEVVTMLPIADGVSGLASRFVDDAYGFALGWCYWLAFAISLPSEIIAGVVMLSYYEQLDIPSATTVVWVFFFIAVIVGINLLDVRVMGEVECATSIVKVLFMVALSIVCVVVNTGGNARGEYIGGKFWDSSRSNTTTDATFGPFRPTFDLADNGTGALGGIGGGFGRFLAILTSTGIASYAYAGTEIVGIAASEAKTPKTSLPSATKNVFWRILFFYILAVFLVGLNLYSGDPRLLRYLGSSEKSNPYSSRYVAAEAEFLVSRGIKVCAPSSNQSGPFSSANKSPWVVMAQSVGMCNFASVVNGFIVFFALSAGSSQLYASSRTLYALSIQNKAPKIFAKCSKAGIPYVSVLFTGTFALLALVGTSNQALRMFQYLANLTSTFVILTWGGMCLSFIRFYYALRQRPDIISRNDKTYPFKSPFQPFLGFFGFIGSFLVILFVGISSFTEKKFDLATFLSSYGALATFTIILFSYKFIYRTRLTKIDHIDLDTGRKESDKEEWNTATNYKKSNKEHLNKLRGLLF